MLIATIFASAATNLSPLPALADVSHGQALVVDAVRAAPMADLGADAIRFSSTPALGGVASIVELRRTQTGAVGQVRTFRGHPQSGWTQLTQRAVNLTETRYHALAVANDAALARGAPRDLSGDIRVCSDGPGWLTERRVGQHDRRLSGFCGDGHPNARIAALIAEAAPIAPTLGDIDGLLPETAGRLVLSGRRHGMIQHVAKQRLAPIDPPGQSELLLVERPLMQTGGCTRQKWTAKFHRDPNRPMAEARFAGAYPTTEVALAPAAGGCAAGEFVNVNPGVGASEALTALRTLRGLLTETPAPSLACLDRSDSKLCVDRAAVRQKLVELPVWALTRRGESYAFWLGTRGQIVTEVRFDPSSPGQATVERMLPNPA